MFIIMGAAVCLGLQIIFGHTLIQKAFDVILKGRKVTNFAQVHIALGDVLLLIVHLTEKKELFSTKAVIIFL